MVQRYEQMRRLQWYKCGAAYDHPKHYRICKADKYLRNFSDPVDIKGVTAPQHGSFMRITKNEYKMLQKWDKELKNKAK